MKSRHSSSTPILPLAVFLGFAVAANGDGFTVQPIATGLNRPTGIAVEGSGTVYFTEIPTPGVPGGANGVFQLDLGSGAITTRHVGEPEPVNIALDRDHNLYWTCKSAGVILRQSADGAETMPVLTGLLQPSGVAVERSGALLFTEIPTPGVMMGMNRVSRFDGDVVEVLHSGEPEPTDIVAGRDGSFYWTCKSAGVILAQNAAGETMVLRSGLQKPTGIALDHKGSRLFWTEVPNPGGGPGNRVMELDLVTMTDNVVHEGDPEPTDIAVARNGNLYWTCTSAGVIVEARRNGGRN